MDHGALHIIGVRPKKEVLADDLALVVLVSLKMSLSGCPFRGKVVGHDEMMRVFLSGFGLI